MNEMWTSPPHVCSLLLAAARPPAAGNDASVTTKPILRFEPLYIQRTELEPATSPLMHPNAKLLCRNGHWQLFLGR